MGKRAPYAAAQITGINELYSALRASPKRLDKKMGQANKKVVNQAITPRVKRKAPRLTGRLRGSVRGSASARYAALLVGSNSIPYAGVINWGWPAHNIKPQEFIYSGIKAGEPEMMDIYLQALDEVAKLIAPEGRL